MSIKEQDRERHKMAIGIRFKILWIVVDRKAKAGRQRRQKNY